MYKCIRPNRFVRINLLLLAVAFIALRVTGPAWHASQCACGVAVNLDEATTHSLSCSCDAKAHVSDAEPTNVPEVPHDSDDCPVCQWLSEYYTDLGFAVVASQHGCLEIIQPTSVERDFKRASVGKARAPPRELT
jgi:hypothetical protein